MSTHVRVNRILCLFLFDFQIFFLFLSWPVLKNDSSLSWLIQILTSYWRIHNEWKSIKYYRLSFHLHFNFLKLTEWKFFVGTPTFEFLKNKKKCSATGNRTPVSRVTGGDTHHYTIVETLKIAFVYFINVCFTIMIFHFFRNLNKIIKKFIIIIYIFAELS